MPRLSGAQLTIAQAMVVWLNSKSAVQALGTVKLDLSLAPHPRYPTDPIADCPLLLLQANVANNGLAVGNGRDSIYQYSLWYYRVQTVGQDHQTKLLEALVAIEAETLSDARPNGLSVAGSDLLTPKEVRIHDQITHPLDDQPRLRVSCGEILYVSQSRG